MSAKSHKLRLWLVSLGAVLAIYLVYSRLNETTPIKSPDRIKSVDAVEEFDSKKVGKVGDVGIGTIEKARFTDLNPKTKELEREFGFEELLHDTGDAWEIKKPYMNIYRRSFKCLITADTGTIMLEPDTKRPSPKDATLKGNVVVHILSSTDSGTRESFLYLDDVTFISEFSRFSSPGPVKFVSRDAWLTGRGLELIYNDQAGRLEYLRIVDLEKLTVKVPSQSIASSPSSPQPDKTAAAPQPKAVQADPSQQTDTETSQPAEPRGQYYRCVLRKNVVIDTPEHVVFADEVLINDIFSSKSSDTKTQETSDTESIKATESPAGAGDIQKTATAAEAEKKSATGQTEPNAPDQQFVDVVATCDGGITVTPMDSSGTVKNFLTLPPAMRAGDNDARTFNNMVGRKTYVLSAPKLTVDLLTNAVSANELKHVTADGGVVQLAMIKKAQERRLGFTKLKSLRFDFDVPSQLFTAVDGLVAVDNSKAAEPNEDTGKFSMEKPCYASLQDFDTLEYRLNENLLIADARSHRITIGYIPIVEGQYGPQTKATAGHIEAILLKDPEGGSKLSTLTAKNGITYNEQRKKRSIQFEGSNLFYDAEKSLVIAWGDQSWPCLLNGASVDGIEYNLKKGKAKAKVVAPGAF